MRKHMLGAVLAAVILGSGTVCYGSELFEGAWDALNINVNELKGGVLGVGVLYAPSVYIDARDSIYPVPIAVLEYRGFFVDGQTFGYVLNPDKKSKVRLSVVGSPRLMGYNHKDSPVFAGMDDRDWSLDGGLRFSWMNDYFDFSVTGLTDLLNKSNGQEIKAFVSKDFLGGFFTPRIGVKWQSQNLVDYYYGVQGGEIAANRPAYDGQDTMIYAAGATVSVPIGEKWAVTLDGEYEHLGSGIRNSPLVDAKHTVTTVLGFVYRY